MKNAKQQYTNQLIKTAHDLGFTADVSIENGRTFVHTYNDDLAVQVSLYPGSTEPEIFLHALTAPDNDSPINAMVEYLKTVDANRLLEVDSNIG